MLAIEVLTDEEEGNQGKRDGDERAKGTPRTDAAADLVPDDSHDTQGACSIRVLLDGLHHVLGAHRLFVASLVNESDDAAGRAKANYCWLLSGPWRMLLVLVRHAFC